MKLNNIYIARVKKKNNLNEGSVAGNMVQWQIFEDLVSYDSSAKYLFFEPYSSWPRGPLFVKGEKGDNGLFVSYLNIYVIREIIFSSYILFYSLFSNNIIQYNSYLIQNLILFFLRIFLFKKVICIFQDFRTGSGFSFKDKLYDYLSVYFLRYYSCNVVVSNDVAKKFKLKNYYIFPGAITYFGKYYGNNDVVDNYAVYAGALEPHNGVDILVSQWYSQDIQLPLHIYGNGSLFSELKKYESEYIKIHGYHDAEQVNLILSRAKVNFCLRYSRGINQNFFFPSKFFNLCEYPGYLIVNKFNNIPINIFPHLILVNDNLDNLKDTISEIDKYNVKARQEEIQFFTWYNCFNNVFNDVLK